MAESEKTPAAGSYGTLPESEKGGLGAGQPAPYPAQPQQLPPYQQGSAAPTYQGYQNPQVIVKQPLLAPNVVQQPTRHPTSSIVAIIVGGVSFTVLASFGVFWSLPFAIIAIVLGIISYEKGRAGDMRKCKKYGYCSFCCSLSAWISLFVGAGMITGIVFAVIAASNNNDDPNINPN